NPDHVLAGLPDPWLVGPVGVGRRGHAAQEGGAERCEEEGSVGDTWHAASPCGTGPVDGTPHDSGTASAGGDARRAPPVLEQARGGRHAIAIRPTPIDPRHD